ncbi:NADH-quinone oxidoreductase subunit C [Bacillus sp. AGMB 02131]|uniref:NADH-quinone oxidoreductase subunit C n=2 Tax=Peribacillus faecalis TaxID=2772559 RepID=A0A927CYL2_9BACI|nr:NADH-quinone oxidoreductase subunit C [Peribacillus faecalis]
MKRLAERNKQKEQASDVQKDIKVKALQNQTPEEVAKAKAAAAAKAKAAALAKQKEKAAGEANGLATDEEKRKAKEKAAVAAKAKAAALAKQKEKAAGEANSSATDEEKRKAKEKAVAAAKAKAAALAKQKERKSTETEEEEKLPAPNQSVLDEYVKNIVDTLGKDVLEETYINRLSKNVPTLVAKREYYFKLAEFLKNNLSFNYLSELHGTDFITHMEVYVYLYSHSINQSIVLKTKLDREESSIHSLVPLWEGANWPECEAYDLLGIQFENHPDLKRILLGEDWVGHPLRKDYEPFDVEV